MRSSKAARYSKRVILLCLIVMTAMFVIDTLLCWRAGEQLDSSSVAAMAGFWGAEVFSSAWIKVTEEKQKRKREEHEDQPEP